MTDNSIFSRASSPVHSGVTPPYIDLRDGTMDWAGSIDGVAEAVVCYMNQPHNGFSGCFPTGTTDFSVVDSSHLENTVAPELIAASVTDVVMDIEWSPTNSTTDRWEVYSVPPNPNRSDAIALWPDVIAGLRAGGYTGTIGMYSNTARWSEFARYTYHNDTYNAGVQYAYNMQLEEDLAPLQAQFDVLYPSVYAYHVGNNPALPLDEKKERLRHEFEMSHTALSYFNPGKPIQWFISPNDTSTHLPDGLYEWQIRELRQYGYPQIVWNAPTYPPNAAEIELMEAINRT